MQLLGWLNRLPVEIAKRLGRNRSLRPSLFRGHRIDDPLCPLGPLSGVLAMNRQYKLSCYHVASEPVVDQNDGGRAKRVVFSTRSTQARSSTSRSGRLFGMANGTGFPPRSSQNWRPRRFLFPPKRTKRTRSSTRMKRRLATNVRFTWLSSRPPGASLAAAIAGRGTRVTDCAARTRSCWSSGFAARNRAPTACGSVGLAASRSWAWRSCGR